MSVLIGLIIKNIGIALSSLPLDFSLCTFLLYCSILRISLKSFAIAPLFAIDPTTSACRGFESDHTNDEKAPHLVRRGAFSSRGVNGGRKKILHLNCLFSTAYEKNINIWF